MSPPKILPGPAVVVVAPVISPYPSLHTSLGIWKCPNAKLLIRSPLVFPHLWVASPPGPRPAPLSWILAPARKLGLPPLVFSPASRVSPVIGGPPPVTGKYPTMETQIMLVLTTEFQTPDARPRTPANFQRDSALPHIPGQPLRVLLPPPDPAGGSQLLRFCAKTAGPKEWYIFKWEYGTLLWTAKVCTNCEFRRITCSKRLDIPDQKLSPGEPPKSCLRVLEVWDGIVCLHILQLHVRGLLKEGWWKNDLNFDGQSIDMYAFFPLSTRVAAGDGNKMQRYPKALQYLGILYCSMRSPRLSKDFCGQWR
ncbi:hypothetical protein C7212DRAFT_344857 [Tuber magnatum]|uniref:Uncharacterized protein n=1 Tax=Tuber magnatum TaxID=42249 RepID=A0A317SPX2_9PEZI|nr:hypothetical protein C7212DRAFT_344857 [Tuber magnatum]